MINKIGMNYNTVGFRAKKTPVNEVVDKGKNVVQKEIKKLTAYEKAVLAEKECSKKPDKTEEILTKIFGRPPIKI